LVRKRDNVLNEYKHRDLIEDYTNYNSEAYAPLTRHGSFPDKNADNFQVRNKYLDTFQGLLELEASLPPFVLQVNMKPPKRVTSTKDGYMKRKFREQKRLDDIYTVRCV
jgi:pregnane X receptor